MKRALLITSIVISPLFITMIAGAIADHLDGDRGDASYGIASIGALFIGIPLVFFIGLIVSFIVRNRPNYDRLSIIGYAVPAVLISGFNILSFVGNIK